MSPSDMGPPRFVRLSLLALLAVVSSAGCQRLNLWEGPQYRDDPVVSQLEDRTPPDFQVTGP